MSIAIINPNSTKSMTDAMVEAASRAAPTLSFSGQTSHKGPAAIQGREDGMLATPHLLDLVAETMTKGTTGIIIGCFDDTALPQASRGAPCPVIGLGQASYFYAALRNWRFSVVTTMSVSVPVLEENIRAYGLGQYLAKVRASDVPVLDLEKDTAAAGQRILTEAQRAVAEDDIDAIILGCAGMVQVVDLLRATLEKAVIDPVTCAATSYRWMLDTRNATT